MTRFKDFGAGSTAKDAEPITFKLHDETFTAKPWMQGSTLINLAKNASSDDGVAVADAVLGIFEKVLVPESYVRFEALINSDDKPVDVETLGEITGWLV